MDTTSKQQSEVVVVTKKKTKGGIMVTPSENVIISGPDAWINQAMAAGKFDLVEKFMDLRDREKKTAGVELFNKAFTLLQEEIPELIKNKEGAQKRYKYAELPELQKHLRKPIAKHGFSIRWDQVEEGEKVTVICFLKHTAGHIETSSLSGKPSDVISGSAEKNNDYATNGIQKKATLITYLRRYTYTAVLGISTGDQDADGVVKGVNRSGLKSPSDQEFKDMIKAVAAKKMSIDDCQKLYSLSAEHMHTLSKL